MFTARYVLHSTFCPHSVFMCFVWIWEQTAIISLYSTDWLVFITETQCVYCAVRTGSLYTIPAKFILKSVKLLQSKLLFRRPTAEGRPRRELQPIEQWLYTDKVRKIVYIACHLSSLRPILNYLEHCDSLAQTFTACAFFKHFPVHKYLAVCAPDAHGSLRRCSRESVCRVVHCRTQIKLCRQISLTLTSTNVN